MALGHLQSDLGTHTRIAVLGPCEPLCLEKIRPKAHMDFLAPQTCQNRVRIGGADAYLGEKSFFGRQVLVYSIWAERLAINA